MQEPKKREERKKVKVVADVVIQEETQKMICGDLSMHGCMLLVPRMINPKTRVLIRFYLESASDGILKAHTPIPSIVRWCKANKQNPKILLAGIQFISVASAAQGVPQILHPERFKKAPKKKIILNNKSLRGIEVECPVCGETDIVYLALRAKTMRTQANIFGIPTYIKEMPGKDFCDYNLHQVTVCPKCYFASNDIQFFQRKDQESTELPFALRPFAKTWKPLIATHQAKIGENDRIFTEKRTAEDANLAYTLAMNALDILIQQEEDYSFPRKKIGLAMMFAEVLMSQGKRKEAEEQIQMASDLGQKIFTHLDGEAIIRMALLISLINIYLQKYENVSQYMGFLQNYDPEGEIPSDSQEGKILRFAQQILLKTYQDRAMYAKDKLKKFHLPE